MPAPRRTTPEAPVGAETKYPGGPAASAAGVGVDGASHAAGGGGGGGGDPGGGAGAAAALCTMKALEPATSQGSNPMGAWPRAQGAPAGGASSGAVAARSTSSSDTVAARSATSSGAAAESTDGLHPAMETVVATNSMAAKGNEAVAATVLADQTEEEGDKACHLTGGEYFLSSPFSVAFRSRWLFYVLDNVF
ncbi:POU domain, class 4, transcription factor 1-like [Triticum aestivum]|uniref:POU domain, class 4, transcription factor 1-like n=1 Tax=Triticum aestivum TaxID=4565 RepID=UPI001D010412|nr:POU domain, class 4, transcription factor 1-like [Triticum aestivum]